MSNKSPASNSTKKGLTSIDSNKMTVSKATYQLIQQTQRTTTSIEESQHRTESEIKDLKRKSKELEEKIDEMNMDLKEIKQLLKQGQDSSLTTLSIKSQKVLHIYLLILQKYVHTKRNNSKDDNWYCKKKTGYPMRYYW